MSNNRFEILYIGPLNVNGTCYQRFLTFKRIFKCVYGFDTYVYKKNILVYYLNVFFNKNNLWFDFLNINKAVSGFNKKIDFVWVDKGLTISWKTLEKIKIRHNCKLIHYSPDDMFNSANQSKYYLKSIKTYDYHITTKSYNVQELKSYGAKDVFFINNCFDDIFHSKINFITPTYEVGFIGSFEIERAEILFKLARRGIKLTIRGNWPQAWVRKFKEHKVDICARELDFPEYNIFIQQCKINLCFLRKANRDLQTTRSIEIPAMGGFMLAEDTYEHRILFKENIEAVFFNNIDTLINKIVFYLTHDEERKKIQNAGYLRCHESGYSNFENFNRLFSEKIVKVI
ncbi:spore protein YkvP [mine drainage metagenome]|uniref:Spore protein YkvP n=1 Tax=mine drainage metagenome TaxID=410659 RepID=A0A1J5SF22_9ZZZZ